MYDLYEWSDEVNDFIPTRNEQGKRMSFEHWEDADREAVALTKRLGRLVHVEYHRVNRRPRKR